MSINNIHLTSHLCKDLFENSLVGQTKVEKALLPSANDKLEFLGKNRKNIVFIMTCRDCKYIPDEQMDLLVNLLSACKLNMDDIALLNISNYPSATIEDIKQQLACTKVLVFGTGPMELKLPFKIPEFQIQKFEEQVYLFGPSFELFLNNVALKKDLWISLKKIFTI